MEGGELLLVDLRVPEDLARQVVEVLLCEAPSCATLALPLHVQGVGHLAPGHLVRHPEQYCVQCWQACIVSSVGKPVCNIGPLLCPVLASLCAISVPYLKGGLPHSAKALSQVMVARAWGSWLPGQLQVVTGTLQGTGYRVQGTGYRYR